MCHCCYEDATSEPINLGPISYINKLSKPLLNAINAYSKNTKTILVMLYFNIFFVTSKDNAT